jgi:hypothetical protein
VRVEWFSHESVCQKMPLGARANPENLVSGRCIAAANHDL